jgi:hypothetical protein
MIRQVVEDENAPRVESPGLKHTNNRSDVKRAHWNEGAWANPLTVVHCAGRASGNIL